MDYRNLRNKAGTPANPRGLLPPRASERQCRVADLLESFPARLGNALRNGQSGRGRRGDGNGKLRYLFRMKRKYLLEISVESANAAAAAVRGGADRLELCANLRAGGVTPGAELMKAARQRVSVPVFAMIRPRAGDFAFSQTELASMR